jgi:hypothetical protein
MMIKITLLCLVIGGICFWVGTKYSPIEQMEDFTTKLEEMNKDDQRHLKEMYSLCMPVLKALEENKIEEAKGLLVEEFGRFYYNYTYEDERYMNPEIIEGYLKEFEALASTQPSFKKIIEYKPKE